MKNKIYYFDIPSQTDEKIDNQLLKLFAEMVLNVGSHHMAFADCEKDRDQFYLFWPEYKIQELVALFKGTGAEMQYKDVTDEILNSSLKNKEFEEAFSVEKTYNLLKEFMLSNLTQDMILDKINEQGIESLNEFDKTILSSMS
jgi:hypothetical protein